MQTAALTDGLCHLAFIQPEMIGRNWRHRIPGERDARADGLAAFPHRHYGGDKRILGGSPVQTGVNIPSPRRIRCWDELSLAALSRFR